MVEHPGQTIRERCMQPFGLNVTQTAEALGVSRKTLSMILNGRASISPEMAVRLSIAFNTTAQSWLYHQADYDLSLVEQRRDQIHVKPLLSFDM
tara:strand:+ start:87 stop:368 length:282 start_codon:yes stop_codon:yes gene_type:complete